MIQMKKIKRAEEDIQLFDEKELRYPKGIREFKAQTDFRELENGLVDAREMMWS